MRYEDIGKKYKDENGNEHELISFCEEPTVTFKDSKGDTTTFSQHSILMERLTPIKKKLSDKIRNTNTLNGNVNVIQVADVNDFIKDITTFMVKMKMKMDGYNHPIKYIYELAGDRFK